MIPLYKERLEEVEKKIAIASNALATLTEQRNTLIQNIQDECPHPEQFLKDEDTNWQYRDPGCAPRHKVTCTACGKMVDEYDLVGGVRHEIRRD